MVIRAWVSYIYPVTHIPSWSTVPDQKQDCGEHREGFKGGGGETHVGWMGGGGGRGGRGGTYERKRIARVKLPATTARNVCSQVVNNSITYRDRKFCRPAYTILL